MNTTELEPPTDPDAGLYSNEPRLTLTLNLPRVLKRIEACVNACEGLNPEGVPDAVEALTQADHAISAKLVAEGMPEDAPTTGTRRAMAEQLLLNALTEIRAAIRKVKGEGA